MPCFRETAQYHTRPFHKSTYSIGTLEGSAILRDLVAEAPAGGRENGLPWGLSPAGVLGKQQSKSTCEEDKDRIKACGGRACSLIQEPPITSVCLLQCSPLIFPTQASPPTTNASSIFPLPDLQAAAIGSENNVLGRVRLINLFDGAPLATAHELFRSAVHHVASFLPGGVGFADLVNGGVFNLEVQVHAEPAAITFTEDNANAAVTSQAWASFSDAGAWYVTRWQKPGQWLDLSQAMQGLSGRLSDTVTVADEDWHNGYRITFHCPLSLRSAITTDTVKVTIHVYNTAASDSSTSSQYEPEGSSTGGTVFSTSITGHGPPLDLVQSQGHFGSDTHQAILSVKSLTASTTDDLCLNSRWITIIPHVRLNDLEYSTDQIDLEPQS